jgi:competence protein ComEA
VEPIPPSSPDDDLEHLLRPRRRGPAWQVLLERARRADRRVLIAAAAVVAVVAAALGIVAWRSRPVPVTLPMASTDETAGGPSGAAASTGASAVDSVAATTTTAVGGPLVVHVAGAVVRPGLVTLPAGGRTADAIAAAGGATAAADLDRVNLAAPVTDGVRIYIPSVGQVEVPAAVGPAPAVAGGAAEAAGGPPAPVDLNAATETELETLPGVGPATAAAILAHRAAEGPFASVDDLDDVRGIGPAKLEQLRDLVTVG